MKLILLAMSAIIIFAATQVENPDQLKTYYSGTPTEQVVIQSPRVAATPSCLERPEICGALTAAGFTEDQLPLMMAIARAESGWRIDALGDTTITTGTWGPSVGIFQIRTLKTQNKGCRDRDKLTGNLQEQASCAKQIWDTQGYKAWSAYTNGAYRQFLK